MSNLIVAGLDMATTTGICVGKPGQTPEFWSVDLGLGKPHDVRFSNALALAHDLINVHNVGLIGIEAPIRLRTDKAGVNSILMGIQAMVRGWSFRKGIPTEVIAIQTLDKHFLGRAGMSSSDRKAGNVRRCQLLGWSPATEDEADAGSVWDYMCSTTSRSHAVQTTSLFGGVK